MIEKMRQFETRTDALFFFHSQIVSPPLLSLGKGLLNLIRGLAPPDDGVVRQFETIPHVQIFPCVVLDLSHTVLLVSA